VSVFKKKKNQMSHIKSYFICIDLTLHTIKSKKVVLQYLVLTFSFKSKFPTSVGLHKENYSITKFIIKESSFSTNLVQLIYPSSIITYLQLCQARSEAYKLILLAWKCKTASWMIISKFILLLDSAILEKKVDLRKTLEIMVWLQKMMAV